jgi:hypothetical protein
VKREAAGNTKMKKLCKILGIRQYAAVGILESLWHLTARETPQGDIGRLSNEDIALGLDWDDDPERLVAALIEARWLDMSRHVRLVVHDWHEHADESVKRKLARNCLPFLSIESCLDTDRQKKDVDRLPGAGAVPEPVPVPSPEPGPGSAIAPPPLDWTRDTEPEIPEGLAKTQYGKFACDRARIPAGYGLQVKVGDAIFFLAELEHCGHGEATARMVPRLKEAQSQGAKIHLWLDDGGWKTNGHVKDKYAAYLEAE